MFREVVKAMHEAKREATVLEIPAEKRTLIVKSGDSFPVPAGAIVKLVEVLKGHGQRVVVEVTVPTSVGQGSV